MSNAEVSIHIKKALVGEVMIVRSRSTVRKPPSGRPFEVTIDIKNLAVDWMPLGLTSRKHCGVELFAKIDVTQHSGVAGSSRSRENLNHSKQCHRGFHQAKRQCMFRCNQIVRQRLSHLGPRACRIQIIERSVAVKVCMLAIATIVEKIHKMSIRVIDRQRPNPPSCYPPFFQTGLA